MPAPGKKNKKKIAAAKAADPNQVEKFGELNQFTWYPGHIAKAERQLKEKISAIDMIVEIRDARIPLSSEHRDLSTWACSKPIIVALNKNDLAHKAKSQSFLQKEAKELIANSANIKAVTKLNCKDPQSVKALLKKISEIAAPIVEKYKSKGLRNRPIRVMIVGYPNTGKSTIINRLSKTKKAKAANKAGVTKQQQWVDIQDPKSPIPIKLLDTPGIIPTRFYSEVQALKLALCNCLGENAYDTTLVAQAALQFLESVQANCIRNYYQVPEEQELSLDNICKARRWFLNGEDDFDTNRAALKVLKDFQDLRFGSLSLD